MPKAGRWLSLGRGQSSPPTLRAIPSTNASYKHLYANVSRFLDPSLITIYVLDRSLNIQTLHGNRNYQLDARQFIYRICSLGLIKLLQGVLATGVQPRCKKSNGIRVIRLTFTILLLPIQVNMLYITLKSSEVFMRK